jgi:hypothetical protein
VHVAARATIVPCRVPTLRRRSPRYADRGSRARTASADIRGASRARGGKPYAPFCWSVDDDQCRRDGQLGAAGRRRMPDAPTRIAARRIESEELWPTT